MEFKVTTDLTVFKQPILFNADELKAELTQRLERYNTLVVTEDAIRDAKADRATLNQLRTAMENKRKEIKAQCETPYAAFKVRYDDVIALIDKPITAIDGQIKTFDDKRKEEKLAEVTAFWNKNVGKFADYVSFQRVFNAKWLNATYKISDITNEIMGALLKAEEDLKAIRELHSDFETEALNEYAASNSLNAAIGKVRALEDRRKTEAERKAEREKKTGEAVGASPAQAQARPAQDNPPQSVQVSQEEATEKVTVLDFRVHVTSAQMAALRDFLVKNGIEYGRVPREGL